MALEEGIAVPASVMKLRLVVTGPNPDPLILPATVKSPQIVALPEMVALPATLREQVFKHFSPKDYILFLNADFLFEIHQSPILRE